MSIVDDFQPTDTARENEICVDDISENEGDNEDDLISDICSTGDMQKIMTENAPVEVDAEGQRPTDSINHLLTDDQSEPTQAESNLINEILNHEDIDVVSVVSEVANTQVQNKNTGECATQETIVDFLVGAKTSQELEKQLSEPNTTETQFKGDEVMAEILPDAPQEVVDPRVLELKASLIPIQTEVDELKSSIDSLESQITTISNPIMKSRQQKRLEELKGKLSTKLEEVAAIDADIDKIINPSA